MILLRTHRLPGPVSGMALWPFVLIRPGRESPVLLNHERIHLRQQIETLVLPFYVVYLGHYLVNRVRYRTHDRAYREIAFEREAYAHAADLSYLARRRPWAFLRYF